MFYEWSDQDKLLFHDFPFFERKLLPKNILTVTNYLFGIKLIHQKSSQIKSGI